MKKIFRIIGVILINLSIILIHSCKKDSDNATKIKKDKISGYVQKGPYINGTSIQMYELNSSLHQTGKVFSTQITDNKGSFEIDDIALSSQFVEFSASGYYFNEITGEISSSQLSLNALSDIADITTVNVNILTNLEKSRVDYLVGKGKVFSEAKDTAQKEVLAIFGYQPQNMDNSEMLNISLNKEENAILLAISIILQGDRSEGDLTELLANITTDIQQDGKLNDTTIISNLRSNALTLDLANIRSNLEKRYQDLGLSIIIPAFEKYINDFLSFTGLNPTATTQDATNITTTSATLNGLINANDLSTVVTFEYGITTDYGSTTTAAQSPVTSHLDTSVSAALTGLNQGTLYHFRLKGVNSRGTVYGDDRNFTTGAVCDYDGNIYKSIGIGFQIWMAENLKTTRYRNGDLIGTTTPATLDITKEITPKYQWAYNGNEGNVAKYGRLYTWYAVTDSRNLCPAGWHVPTDDEWSALYTYLGGDNHNVGGKLKEKGTTHWGSPNYGATNETGFTALPGGSREWGVFSDLGAYTFWWSSADTAEEYATGAFCSFDAGILDIGNRHKEWGYSVRCIKDN